MSCNVQFEHGVLGSLNVIDQWLVVPGVQLTSVGLELTVQSSPLSPFGSAMSASTCALKSVSEAPSGSKATRNRPECPIVSRHATVICDPAASVVTLAASLPPSSVLTAPLHVWVPNPLPQGQCLFTSLGEFEYRTCGESSSMCAVAGNEKNPTTTTSGHDDFIDGAYRSPLSPPGRLSADGAAAREQGRGEHDE